MEAFEKLAFCKEKLGECAPLGARGAGGAEGRRGR